MQLKEQIRVDLTPAEKERSESWPVEEILGEGYPPS
jgi:hypothetical protein